jgi:hypothetical protein
MVEPGTSLHVATARADSFGSKQSPDAAAVGAQAVVEIGGRMRKPAVDRTNPTGRRTWDEDDIAVERLHLYRLSPGCDEVEPKGMPVTTANAGVRQLPCLGITEGSDDDAITVPLGGCTQEPRERDGIEDHVVVEPEQEVRIAGESHTLRPRHRSGPVETAIRFEDAGRREAVSDRARGPVAASVVDQHGAQDDVRPYLLVEERRQAGERPRPTVVARENRGDVHVLTCR